MYIGTGPVCPACMQLYPIARRVAATLFDAMTPSTQLEWHTCGQAGQSSQCDVCPASLNLSIVRALHFIKHRSPSTDLLLQLFLRSTTPSPDPPLSPIPLPRLDRPHQLKHQSPHNPAQRPRLMLVRIHHHRHGRRTEDRLAKGNDRDVGAFPEGGPRGLERAGQNIHCQFGSAFLRVSIAQSSTRRIPRKAQAWVVEW